MVNAVTSTVTVAAAAALAVFITLYAALAPWYRSPAGRALMVMSTGFFLVLSALMLRHPFSVAAANSTAFDWFQAAAAGVALAGIGHLTLVLVRAQRRGRYFADDRAWLRKGKAVRRIARALKAAWLFVFGDARKEMDGGSGSDT